MPTDITGALPDAVAAHIAAYNAHDPEALMATLAPDALVNDVRREFLGHAAIRAWADKEIFGDNVTLAVERALDQHGDVVLHVRVDGDYDKTGLPDPLILTYYFSLRDGLITQLIIVHNKPAA
ncbi:MAG: nuclear transport factor 2 family protein [Caulobacteraceae bacterium]